MDKWDIRFLEMADSIGTWSSCYQENRHVGAVIVKDKRVLIVDDVSTTGATSETLAQKLKKAGASEVYLLTIASVAFNHNRK